MIDKESFSIPGQTEMRFDGGDGAYDPDRDDVRLAGQIKRVWHAMLVRGWCTLEDLEIATGDPQASISAQMRHLRKNRFGGHTVHRRFKGSGLWEYRLTPRSTPLQDSEL